MGKFLNHRTLSRTSKTLCLLTLAALLSGCVVVPAYGPRYYRPAPYYYR